MPEEIGLSLTRPETRNGEPACMQLGGTAVYAASEARLRKGLADLSDVVVRSARAHASLDRRSLLSLVAKGVGHRLEQKLFDAVVGSQLRLGNIDRVACQAEGGAVYRAVVASERLEEFDRRCDEVAMSLSRSKILSIRDLRDLLFDSSWGTWSSTTHIVGRLALLGRAQYVDRFNCAWPEGFEHAHR